MPVFNLNINGEIKSVDVDFDTPLLWVLRDSLRLVGTKYGCGISQCGACTVLVDNQAIMSCSVAVSTLNSTQEIKTIEGLSENNDHPLQTAWKECDVPQCGYCQAGQIMNAAALLQTNSNPNDKEIESAMYRNLCRCGTYTRIKKAIKSAAKKM